jgi:uncharacterized membrane protein YedE/YeeE
MHPYIGGLIGGGLIGLSAVLLLWLNGRIAGISGIFNGVLNSTRGDAAWRVFFLAGLIAGTALYTRLFPAPFSPQVDLSAMSLVVGGFLVGFGTRMGGGCTSGHGICGIARLSVRSLIATAVFLAAGIATVFLVRHVFGGAYDA